MAFNFKKRIQNLRLRLKKEKLDAFVTTVVEENNKNPYYLSGFGGTTGALAISQKGTVLAVDSRYTLRAKKEARGVSVIEIPKGKKGEDFSVYVETALSGLRLSKKSRIGFEGAHVPVLKLKAWEKHIPVNFSATRGIVEKLRQVKDAEELRRLARAGKVTSDVFVFVSKKVRAGMRESEIAALLDIELRKRGALGPSFKAIVASGKNSAIPHHETSERKLRAGEPLVMDFGGMFPSGYCSDVTRTIFVPGKKPTAQLLKIYAVVLGANKKAFKALKPGISWKEYDAVARDYITDAGYGKYFTHGLGHSIGLETHDPYDYARDAFEIGNVVSDEPGIYIEGVGGVRIEDDVVVTKTGAKNITPAPYLSL